VLLRTTDRSERLAAFGGLEVVHAVVQFAICRSYCVGWSRISSYHLFNCKLTSRLLRVEAIICASFTLGWRADRILLFCRVSKAVKVLLCAVDVRVHLDFIKEGKLGVVDFFPVLLLDERLSFILNFVVLFEFFLHGVVDIADPILVTFLLQNQKLSLSLFLLQPLSLLQQLQLFGGWWNAWNYARCHHNLLLLLSLLVSSLSKHGVFGLEAGVIESSHFATTRKHRRARLLALNEF